MKLQKAERRILTVLAQYPEGRSKTQVAILAGYAVGGGGLNNAIGACRTAGYLHGGKEHLQITEAGLGALGEYEPLPTGPDLLAYWLRELSKAERSILTVVTEAYPEALPKEIVAERAGYEVGGGGFNNAVSRLRTLELVTGRAEIKASAALMEG